MDRPEGAQAPWWHLALWWLASVSVAFVHNGLWATPNLAFLSLIAQRPGENPFGEALAGDYLLSDLSLTTLARVLGQSEPHELARLHLVVLLVGWAAVTALAWRRFGYPAARALTVVIGASPLVTVSMQWLGQPDPLTGMCGIAMVLVRRRRAVLAIGVLAGLTHPEQAAFMAAVAGAVRWVLPDRCDAGGPAATTQSAHGNSEGEPTVRRANVRGSRPRPAFSSPGALQGVVDVMVAVAGVVLGWSLTQMWFRLNDMVVRTPRTRYLEYGWSSFVDHHTQQPVGVLWTTWGPLWLAIGALVVAAVLRHREGNRLEGAARAWTVMGTLAVLALVPVAVTLDETRVYAVITAPLLAGAAVWVAAQFSGRVVVAVSAVFLVVVALLPGGFATGTTSWRSQLDTAAMGSFLVDGSVPDDMDLTPWLISPFDFVIPEPPG